MSFERFIIEKNGEFLVRRKLKGRFHEFGTFSTFEEAEKNPGGIRPARMAGGGSLHGYQRGLHGEICIPRRHRTALGDRPRC